MKKKLFLLSFLEIEEGIMRLEGQMRDMAKKLKLGDLGNIPACDNLKDIRFKINNMLDDIPPLSCNTLI